MRIQHNIAALNSYRQLGSNNNAVSKNLEKLSSGYKINRAGDDAAGLAISEKMRAQITGLKTASKNANDGISLIQTAEGALTEVHSMLNRMVELADQSANGTYQDAVDRQNLQKEMNSLKDEIDRISEGTNFNGINLLDGSLGGSRDGATATVAGADITISGAKEGVAVKFSGIAAGGVASAAWNGKTVTLSLVTGATYKQADIDALIASASGAPDDAKGLKVTVDGTMTAAAGTNDTLTMTKAKQASAKGVAVTNTSGASTNITLTSQKSGNITNDLKFTNGGQAGATTDVGGDVQLNLDASKSYTASEINAMLSEGKAGMSVSFEGSIKGADFLTASAGGGDTFTLAGGAGAKGGGGLQLQIGDTADAFNQLTVSVGSMSSSALGIAGVDASTQSGAKAAVQTIKDAINTVSSTRGDLGALQNRLEHTINNLSVTTENMTAAESRIRDVDMAEEMMTYTKNNILVQASQSMLAQANQLPQGVLQLLQ